MRTYRTPSGWRARTTYRDYDGITREIQRAAKTEAAAKRKLSEAIRDRVHISGGADLTPDTRVAVLATVWIEDLATTDIGQTTVQQYQGNLDRCIVPGVGQLRVRELTVSSCDRLVKAIQTKHGGATAKTSRSVLSGMCRYAARHNALDRNPVTDIGTVSTKPKKPPKSMLLDQVKNLRIWLGYDDQAGRRDIPDLVDFMLATGLRISEAAAVRWSGVNFDEWTVSVAGNVVRIKGEGLIIQQEESDKLTIRTLELPSWAVEMLERRFTVASGSDGDVASLAGVPVFPAPRGGLRDPSNTQADLRDAFAFCGYNWVTSHVFRKTVASFMDDAGLSNRAAADQLGHSKPSMTSDKYFGRRRATGAAAVLEVMGDA